MKHIFFFELITKRIKTKTNAKSGN